jgi:hypothetical protein
VSQRKGGRNPFNFSTPWCYARRCKQKAHPRCPGQLLCEEHQRQASLLAGVNLGTIAALPTWTHQQWRLKLAALHWLRDTLTPRVALTADERRVKREADRVDVVQCVARLVAELGGYPSTTRINFGDAAERAEHPRRHQRGGGASGPTRP